MLVLGPGKARELESRINVVDRGKIEVTADTIGRGWITMPRVDSNGHTKVNRGAPELDEMSDTAVKETVSVKLIISGCSEAGERIGTDDKPVSFAVQVVPQIELEVLRIKIQLGKAVVTKPILAKGQAGEKIPRGVGNESGADPAVPEKIILLAVTNEEGVGRIDQCL